MTADRLYVALRTNGDSLIQISSQAQKMAAYFRTHGGLSSAVVEYLDIFSPGQWWTYRNVREQAECMGLSGRVKGTVTICPY